jgi:hypothetical protein
MSCSISQIMPTTRIERKDNGAEGDGAEGGWEDRWAASQEGKKRAYGNEGKTHSVGPAGVEGLRVLMPTDREREKKDPGVNFSVLPQKRTNVHQKLPEVCEGKRGSEERKGGLR